LYVCFQCKGAQILCAELMLWHCQLGRLMDKCALLLLLSLLLQAVMQLSPSSSAEAISSPTQQQQQQPDLPLLLQQALLHFDLWLLLGLNTHVTPATATRQMLNTVMARLAVVAEQAATLAVEYGVDTAAVEAVCRVVRQMLEDDMAERQMQEAAKWRLPAMSFESSSSSSSTAAEASAGSWMLPTGTVPGKLAVGAEQQGLEAAKRRAERNLGSLPYVGSDLPLQSTLQQLLRLCSSSATAAASRDVAMQHGLRSVEAGFFGRLAPALATLAANISSSSSSWYGRAAAMAAAGLGCISEGDSQLLVEVVDAYRLLLQAFQGSAVAMSALAAELRSRELLVTWIQYCLLFEVR
jgi:hypothetical protein